MQRKIVIQKQFDLYRQTVVGAAHVRISLMIGKRSLTILAIALASGTSCTSCSLSGGVSTADANWLTPAEKTTLATSAPPFVPSMVPDCVLSETVENVIVNGGFEKGEFGWTVSSNGTGSTWREHSLIGTGTSFSPYSGVRAARLGGYEGSSDRLEQQVFIPSGAKLRYWWKGIQPRPVSQLTVSLMQLDGSDAARLVIHRHEEAEERWQQDCIDLSAYAGQEYVLEFHVFNDNYTMMAFYIDGVVLSNGQDAQ